MDLPNILNFAKFAGSMIPKAPTKQEEPERATISINEGTGKPVSNTVKLVGETRFEDAQQVMPGIKAQSMGNGSDRLSVIVHVDPKALPKAFQGKDLNIKFKDASGNEGKLIGTVDMSDKTQSFPIATGIPGVGHGDVEVTVAIAEQAAQTGSQPQAQRDEPAILSLNAATTKKAA